MTTLERGLRTRRSPVIPGRGLTLGIGLTYLGLVVLLPFAALGAQAARTGGGELAASLGDPRVLAAFRLSFGAAATAGAVNVVVGLLLAWVLVRYRFPGRRLADALVDLPFALPTAVAGIALTTLYAPTGALGGALGRLGLQVAFTPVGVTLALVFVGLPFVVRTVQPVLEDLGTEDEEAAAILGATRAQAFRRVILPELVPSLLTGFSLALARGLGEYGSVVFIAGNMPMRTEIVPLLIVGRLEQYDYGGAAALALAMLIASFAVLLAVNAAQAWSARRARGA